MKRLIIAASLMTCLIPLTAQATESPTDIIVGRGSMENKGSENKGSDPI